MQQSRNQNVGGTDSFSWVQAVMDEHAATLKDSDREKSELEPYSHGLESIYTIEEVDLKTIRPLHAGNKTTSTEKKVSLPLKKDDRRQLLLPLGPEHVERIKPLESLIPISFLSLSSKLNQLLTDNGFRSIQDLQNEEEFITIEGMGHGHLDELRSKRAELKEYRRFISGETLVKIATTGTEPSELEPLLKPYGIDWILPQKKRSFFSHSSKTSVKVDLTSAKTQIEEALSRVVHAFIIPWIRKRGGVATPGEIEERLERLSIDSELNKKVFQFLRDHFFQGKSFLPGYLENKNEEIYFSDQESYRLYQRVIEMSETYFYQFQEYSLPLLISWIEREVAKSWEAFPEGFVESSFMRCPNYKIECNQNGEKFIRPAYCFE